jgi:hypothetical protein
MSIIVSPAFAGYGVDDSSFVSETFPVRPGSGVIHLDACWSFRVLYLDELNFRFTFERVCFVPPFFEGFY